MCGICGFNSKDDKSIKVLTDLLRHRGPDQTGVFTDDKVSLGHRRLSILDLTEHGRQPMTNEDGTVRVVFNGEVFNYPELKTELEGKGHTFTSHTDTEVLVHLYEEEGPGMARRLNGQFAFCIYDSKKGTLFLARDRVGIIPLFYYYTPGDKFIFGSELKVIMRSGVENEIDKEALTFYLRFNFISSPRCILKNCAKLQPGHWMTYDLASKKVTAIERYWDIDFKGDITDPEEAVRLIREGLTKATEMRLMADVPVGAFLSGGIDSSAVVSTIMKTKPDLKTFSVKFEYKDYDESVYAKMVAGHLKTDHHEIVMKPDKIREIMNVLAEHYDEPSGDSSAVPTYFVSQFARQFVTVCLSGDAGDELLGGYERYRYYLIFRFFNKMPGWIRAFMRFLLSCAIRVTPKFKLERARELLEFDRTDGVSFYEKLVEKIDRKDLKKLLKYKVNFEDTTGDIKKREGIDCVQWHDIVHYLEGDILTKVDRAAMAVSLETRPPFLDHNFIELSCRMARSLRIKGWTGKWILKKAFTGILPDAIIKRKKKGFGVPIEYYLKDELKDIVEKYVFDYDRHDLFDRAFLRSMSEPGRGKQPRDTTRLYWNIIMFNMWHEKWLKKN